MSYISGNTFFIENSINCSNLETINGQVNFIDCSRNCGSVLNAFFSGNGVCNEGQAYGCTIFCNSYSYDCICGTGILRGNSVLYGAADCVIQCDQSIIDAGASVTDYEFLVTTGIPTNIYSCINSYYTYSSGVSTLATGGWSNYYFVGGAISSNIHISTGQNNYAVPYQAQDNCLYYHSAYCSLAYVVDGPYVNGYFCSGCLDNSFYSLVAINPCGYVPSENCSPNQYYLIYKSGQICVPNGFSPISFENNIYSLGIFCEGVNYTVPANLSSFVFCLHEDKYLYFVQAAFIGVQFATLNGAYSSGYFNENNENFDFVSSFNGIFKALPIQQDFCCELPISAQDNSLYYIYCNGLPTLATGLYSNYAINNGTIDCGYSTNMPTCAINCGCYIYESGVAINLSNVNYILDNNLYYGERQFYPYENYRLFPFKSDNTRIGLVAFSEGPQGNINGLIKNSHYFTCQQERGFSDGCRAFYAEFSNIDSCWGIACVKTNFSCSTPFITEEACFPGAPIIKYYIYSGGIGSVANGAFSNFWFENSTVTTCTTLTPQCAQDNNLFYIYCSGTSFTPTDGPYSNYYITGNIVDTLYTCIGVGAPQIPLDVNKYYEYCEGNAYLVTGCRNDINGFDGSPSGTYYYGSNGEYNPIPCFKYLENGLFTYAYFCNGVPNAQVGIVRFSNLTVCCGMDLGNTEPRCVWIYYCGANCCGANCCGIDPVTLGYGINTHREFPYEYATGVICEGADYCWTYSSQIICDSGFISIDNLFYYNLETNTKVQGYYPVCKMAICGLACTNLYCDSYCDVYVNDYDENGEVCGSHCVGQECCGSVCTGSYVSTDNLCICDICVYIGDGTLGYQRCFCQSYCSGTLIHESCSDASLSAECDLHFNSLPYQHVYRYSINLTGI